MPDTPPTRDIHVAINGRDWRQVYEFAQAHGPEAAEAFARGFMRLMETTTALATNAWDGGDPQMRNAFVHITADNWTVRSPADSLVWGVHLVDRLPEMTARDVVSRRVMNGGLIHFGPKEAITPQAVDVIRATSAVAPDHEWSIHT